MEIPHFSSHIPSTWWIFHSYLSLQECPIYTPSPTKAGICLQNQTKRGNQAKHGIMIGPKDPDTF